MSSPAYPVLTVPGPEFDQFRKELAVPELVIDGKRSILAYVSWRGKVHREFLIVKGS